MGQKNPECQLVKSRLFDFDKDYDIVRSWYEKQGLEIPDRYQYPPTGIMVEKAGVPVCCGWIYQTDSVVCVFTFPIADIEADKETRNAALYHLIESAKFTAKKLGFQNIFCPINNKVFLARLKKAGFKIHERNEAWIKL